MTPPLAVKEGWKIVPVEPTPEMVEAGRRAIKEAPDLGGIVSENTPEAYDAYVAMIAAAPTPAPLVVPSEEEIKVALRSSLHWESPDEFDDGGIVGWDEAARAILKLLTEKGEKNG